MLHQIPFRNFQFGNIFHHLLITAFVDDRVEHVVFARNSVPNVANFLRFEFSVTNLKINVASDTAVFKSLAASKQISRLYIGKRERFKAIGAVNDNGDIAIVTLFAQILYQCFFICLEFCEYSGGHRFLRSLVLDFPVFRPQVNSVCFKTVDQILHVLVCHLKPLRCICGFLPTGCIRCCLRGGSILQIRKCW